MSAAQNPAMPTVGLGRLLSAPNLISLFRALLAPAILLLLIAGTKTSLYAALVIACTAAASDFADGYVARRRGRPSEFGRYVDGACDAIFNLAVFLGFLATHWIGPVFFAAIYFAEIVVPYLGTFAKQMGHPFEIRRSARLKTTIHAMAQIAVIGLALLGYPTLSMLVLGMALAASILWLADHAVFAFRRAMRSGLT